MGSSQEVSKRLYMVIVLFIAIICVCAGYLMGRCNDGNRYSEVIPYNLTIEAEKLFRKAKKIPRAIYKNDSLNIDDKLLQILSCERHLCGDMQRFGVADFLKKCLHSKVDELNKAIHQASVYLSRYVQVESFCPINFKT